MRDDLRVTTACECVPVGHETPTDRLVLVQLAVLSSPDRSVLVRKGLVPLADVDDAQASDADCDPRGYVGPSVVGATVSHDLGHALEHVPVGHIRRLTTDLNDTTDPAHLIALYGRDRRRQLHIRVNRRRPQAVAEDSPDLLGDDVDEAGRRPFRCDRTRGRRTPRSVEGSRDSRQPSRDPFRSASPATWCLMVIHCLPVACEPRHDDRVLPVRQCDQDRADAGMADDEARSPNVVVELLEREEVDDPARSAAIPGTRRVERRSPRPRPESPRSSIRRSNGKCVVPTVTKITRVGAGEGCSPMRNSQYAWKTMGSQGTEAPTPNRNRHGAASS